MRQMQPIQILEPQLYSSFKSCSLPGWNQNVSPTNQANQVKANQTEQNDDNLNKVQPKELLGEYGKGFVARRLSEYDPQRPIVEQKRMEEISPTQIHNHYYDQEFSQFTGKTESERLSSLIKMAKEKAQSFDLTEIAFNSNSNVNFSENATEMNRILQLGLMHQEPFPGLAFVNEEQDEIDRMSPVIPLIDSMSLTTKPKRLYAKQLDEENGKDDALKSDETKCADSKNGYVACCIYIPHLF